MNDQGAAATGISIVGMLMFLVLGIGLYVFFCYCYKLICEKAGHDPGVLIWIPIAQWVPLLTVAKLPIWFIVLLIIPCTAPFVFIYVVWKLCEARGKPGALALLLLVPIANLILIPYLAFSD